MTVMKDPVFYISHVTFSMNLNVLLLIDPMDTLI